MSKIKILMAICMAQLATAPAFAELPNDHTFRGILDKKEQANVQR